MFCIYKYNVYNHHKKTVETVLGSKIHELYGVKFFIAHKEDNSFSPVELTTSVNLDSSRCKTEKEAHTVGINCIEKNKDVIGEKISGTLSNFEKLGIQIPVNRPDTPKIKADIIYLQHNKTKNVIQSYFLKRGYCAITQEEYDTVKSQIDKYFKDNESGEVHFVPYDSLSRLANIDMTRFTETTKRDYDLFCYERAKSVLQKAIDSNDIKSIFGILSNNYNKNSITAFTQITGVVMPHQMSKRIPIIQQWLGEKYTNWKTEMDQVALQKQREKEQKEFEKQMSQPIRHNEKIMSVKDFIDCIIAEGYNKWNEHKQGPFTRLRLYKDSKYYEFKVKAEIAYIKQRVK